MSRPLVILIAVLATGGAHADNLGRLFTTPEQRNVAGPHARAPAISPPALTVEGVVQRQGGEPVAFINGEPVRVGDRSRTGARVVAASVSDVTIQLSGTRRATVVVPLAYGRAPAPMTPPEIAP